MRRFVICGDAGVGKSAMFGHLNSAMSGDTAKYARMPGMPNVRECAVSDGVAVCDVIQDRALHTMSAAISCSDFIILAVSAARAADNMEGQPRQSLIERLTTAANPDCLDSLRPYADTEQGRRCGASYGHLLMGRMLGGMRNVIIVVTHMDASSAVSTGGKFNDALYQTCTESAQAAASRCGMTVIGHTWTDKDGSNIVYPKDPSCDTLLEMILDAADTKPIPARMQGLLHMPVLAVLKRPVAGLADDTYTAADTDRQQPLTILPAAQVLFETGPQVQPEAQPQVQPEVQPQVQPEAQPQVQAQTDTAAEYENENADKVSDQDIQQATAAYADATPLSEPPISEGPPDPAETLEPLSPLPEAQPEAQPEAVPEAPSQPVVMPAAESAVYDGLTEMERQAKMDAEAKQEGAVPYDEPVIVQPANPAAYNENEIDENRYVYEDEQTGEVDDYTPWSEHAQITPEEQAQQTENYQEYYDGYFYEPAEAPLAEPLAEVQQQPQAEPQADGYEPQQQVSYDEGQPQYDTPAPPPLQQYADQHTSAEAEDEWDVLAVEAAADGMQNPEPLAEPAPIPAADTQADIVYENVSDAETFYDESADTAADGQMQQSSYMQADDSIICIGRLGGAGTIMPAADLREIRIYDKPVNTAAAGDIVSVRLPAKYAENRIIVFAGADAARQTRRFKAVYRLAYHPAAIRAGHETVIHVGGIMFTCRLISFDLDLNDRGRTGIQYMRTGDCMVAVMEITPAARSLGAIVRPYSHSPMLGRFLTSYSGHITGYGVVIQEVEAAEAATGMLPAADYNGAGQAALTEAVPAASFKEVPA